MMSTCGFWVSVVDNLKLNRSVKRLNSCTDWVVILNLISARVFHFTSSLAWLWSYKAVCWQLLVGLIWFFFKNQKEGCQPFKEAIKEECRFYSVLNPRKKLAQTASVYLFTSSSFKKKILYLKPTPQKKKKTLFKWQRVNNVLHF